MTDESATTRIKKLSPLLINQLAAGEVVTRPAAVVKELLENAIDAEATDINIHITQGGMGMIQISDNGHGIHPDDMVMAITRHATSKVADIGTLQGIRTLGFRGEALAAIAAVSRLQLISSHTDDGVGRQIQVAGVLADTPALTPVVHERGTTVTIKDLYFNVPARRGNLKSVATEFAHIEAMVREVALARADIRIQLTHDHKKRLSLAAQQDSASDTNHPPLSRLEQALGLSLSASALPLHVDLSSLLVAAAPTSTQGQVGDASARIDGWLFLDADSNMPAPKLIYINGRLVKEPIISNQLRQLTPQATGYALYFQLPVHWLNLNVHPSKQRIKIGSISNILAHLSHAVRSALPIATVSTSTSGQPKSAQLHNMDITDNIDKKACAANASTDHAVRTPMYLQSHSNVQAPKAAYQTGTQTDKAGAYLDKTTPTAQTTVQQNLPTRASTYLNQHHGAVPPIRCLSVIDALPEMPASAECDTPLLLLVSKDECCLLSLDVWQSMSDVSTDIEALGDGGNAHTAHNAWQVDTIEQQIQAAIAQLPAQEAAYATLWQHIKAHSNAVLSLAELAGVMLQQTAACDAAQ
ncbi:DNA mismatch repair endonuclease MutL [Psychrobacter aestuarii]|uniref:DNA mismatch repair protein MutL n=1 Tax=Psychrobacter aestuarii TaxID=556327 RepID=A0ABP3FEJ5_9GAMM|nr:DNA mismatch repair endonuclease MutL [Psychrobacter aestuarii]